MCHHTLDVSNPESIEFIKKMLKQYLCSGTAALDKLICDFDIAFKNIRTIRIKDSYYKSLAIAEKLLDYQRNINKEKMEIVTKFHLAARGISLFNSLGLLIKKFYHQEAAISLIHYPFELTGLLENWFYDNAKIWRKNNKESELYRIREAFIEINNYLRNL